MKGNRGYAGMFLANPYPYPVRGCVMLMKPRTQRARGFEGHDWKIVGLFLHILNRPKNPLVPNAGAHLLPEAEATQERMLEAVRCSARLCENRILWHFEFCKLMILLQRTFERLSFHTV